MGGAFANLAKRITAVLAIRRAFAGAVLIHAVLAAFDGFACAVVVAAVDACDWAGTRAVEFTAVLTGIGTARFAARIASIGASFGTLAGIG